MLRLLDKSRPLFRLDQLGMPADIADRLRALIRSPYGMVICAGPTGSGKTTTLYGSLGEINSPERNIMTIEDPVEYAFPSINQIQINEQAGITFAGGLRSILRQDPDVILVGEIRDVETARIAVQSALTGHFVLSSLHATDVGRRAAPLARHGHRGLPDRVVGDRGASPSGWCAASAPTAASRTSRRPRSSRSCAAIGGPGARRRLHARRGCNFCAHTGYLDRIGVYELLRVTDEIRELIVDRAPHDEMRKVARHRGHAHAAGGGAPPGRAGVTTSPRSSAPSTWSGADDDQVRLRRDRPRTATRSRAIQKAASRGDAELALLRAAAPPHPRDREEEPPADRDHRPAGQARGGHAPVPPARARSSRAGLPILEAVQTLGDESDNSSVRRMMADIEDGLRAGERLLGLPRPAPQGLPRRSTAASCARPSYRPARHRARPARRLPRARPRGAPQDQVGADLPGWSSP